MKEIETKIKIQIKAHEANPSPPIGPALGAKGINIMKFCNEFNNETKKIEGLEKGTIVPVVITIFKDKSFEFTIKSPPASILLKKISKIDKGSGSANKNIIANLSMEKIKEIATLKNNDMITNSLESAIKSIIGTAKSMGIKIDKE